MMSVRRASLRNLRAPWKPGESGNPAGRPPGTGGLSFAVMMKTALVLERELWSAPATDSGDTVQRAQEVLVPCSVCRHELHPLIDGLLVLGTPLRAMATAFGLSRSSLHRHKLRHTPTFRASHRGREIVQAETVLRKLLEAFRALAESHGSRFVELAQEATETLYGTFDALLNDSPRNRLLIRMASAAYRLGIVHGHIYVGSDVEEAKAVLEALESWGGDKNEAKTVSKTAENTD